MCSECGLVVGERIVDVSSEWRNFQEGGSDGCRVGYAENAMTGENDLTTNVDCGKSLGSGVSNFKVKSSYEERFTKFSIAQMREICSRLNIGKNVMEDAMRIFKELREKQLLKGKDKNIVMLACIYIECQRNNVARTTKEFVGSMGVCQKKFGKIVNFINKNVELTMGQRCQTTAQDIVSRFCGQLSFEIKLERRAKFQIEKKAKEMAEKTSNAGFLGGTSPVTIASAAIYLAAETLGFSKTFKEICDITSTSEVTLKKCLKSMREHIQEIS